MRQVIFPAMQCLGLRRSSQDLQAQNIYIGCTLPTMEPRGLQTTCPLRGGGGVLGQPGRPARVPSLTLSTVTSVVGRQQLTAAVIVAVTPPGHAAAHQLLLTGRVSRVGH
jgi:hypothetical protein